MENVIDQRKVDGETVIRKEKRVIILFAAIALLSGWIGLLGIW